MEVVVVTIQDDLSKLVEEINQASWDASNDISEYDEEALRAYLSRQDTVFVVCYETSTEYRTLMGIASSRIEMKPYGNEHWLYVDEVDVCADQRQKSAGKLIMQKLLEIAEENGCKELWLGAEVDNHPANALYKSLNPDTISEVVGYTYKTGE